jgi:hypothetical protein
LWVCVHTHFVLRTYSFSLFFLYMCIFKCLLVVMVVVVRSAVRIFYTNNNLYFSLFFYNRSTSINSFFEHNLCAGIEQLLSFCIFFRMFVTTLVFTRKQEAVAQDAKAITTKEKEGRRKKLEGHGLHACKSEYSSKISS